MKGKCFEIIGLLIIFALIVGCSGPSTTLSKTPSPPAPGTIGTVRTPSLTQTVKATDDSIICFTDKTKVHWVEYSSPTGSASVDQHVKIEFTTGTFNDQQVNLERQTETIVAHGTNVMISGSAIMIYETYTDNSGKVLGGIQKQIFGGRETTKSIANANPTSYIEATCFSKKYIKKSPNTETCAVHAGTFVCNKYDLGSGLSIYASPDVPVIIKKGNNGVFMELWGWG